MACIVICRYAHCCKLSVSNLINDLTEIVSRAQEV